MAKFDISIVLIAEAEGGYQANTSDRGNYLCGDLKAPTFSGAGMVCRVGDAVLVGTNLGISAPVLAAHRGRAVTMDEMKSLSESEAREIYKKVFWNPLTLGLIKSQDVANVVFDHAVNAGPSAGVKLLQTAVNNISDAGLAVDGGLGKMTRAAVNKVNANVLFDEYNRLRANFYRSLVARKPNLRQFLNGWINRVNSFSFSGGGSSTGSGSGGMVVLLSLLALTGLSMIVANGFR